MRSEIGSTQRQIGKLLGENFYTYLAKLALLLILLLTIVPFYPLFPQGSLDDSWIYGLNQAVAQGLEFGKDIIFTFGPYASIYTRSFHPDTNLIMMLGSTYIAISLWLSALLLTNKKKLIVTIAFILTYFYVARSAEAILFSYTLIAALNVLVISEKYENSKAPVWIYVIFLLFGPIGLLPLIKGSLLILCTGFTLFCFIFLLSRRQYGLALPLLFSPIISSVALWIISGQPIPGMVLYFKTMMQMSAGYTEAMATNGNTSEILAFLIGAGTLIILVIREHNPLTAKGLLLLLTLSLFLFISFKSGFVRHDGHAILPTVTLVISSVFYLAIADRRTVAIAVSILSFSVWGYVYGNYVRQSPTTLTNNILYDYKRTIIGLKHQLFEKQWLLQNYAINAEKVNKRYSLLTLNGTTDIYSFGQSYLIASGNKWNPRPVFQSYAAYTSQLAHANQKHLTGENPPDNIIFKLEPIDGRLPSLEDGASWATIINNYVPSRLDEDFLYLKKQQGNDTVGDVSVLSSVTFNLGQRVDLPDTDKPIFVEINVERSLAGKLANLLYKTSILEIELTLNNGESRRFRTVSEMMKSGFVLSPLIETNSEFSMLYGNTSTLSGKQVKSFSVITTEKGQFFWKNEVSATFTKINTHQTNKKLNIVPLDKIYKNTSSEIASATECHGGIDKIGVPEISNNTSASKTITVMGWLSQSVAKETNPNSAVMVLTKNDKSIALIETHKSYRADVGAYFKDESLSYAGFLSTFDAKDFEGDYRIGMALNQNGELKLCPQTWLPMIVPKT
ncbi:MULTISPECIES: hypothetical protein [unclassified Pseudomonas]|uniref:hypothetical protein n=1 Tax=unclassified Pseudomonas TaxID=196821 RepID=UPI002AC8F7E1|nr:MULTISPECIES: hypothetical protein [unclassified Pseudomonas]MEB0047230.1 hypothetical protein [Pseudomonas sp. Dout3]MEB0096870.1 hypothetical protein [Pseudomonas sp. DC1.2]WPX57382.1 hypothetical protein RHM68_17355 [Pseudomonas sp. DC1.2]